METVRVELGARSYDILIGAGTTPLLASRLRELGLGADVFVVTSPTIRECCGRRLEEALTELEGRVGWTEFTDGEAQKSLANYERVARALKNFDAKRRIAVIALGGGVVGDLTGFVSATYKRGTATDYVQVPTTLLGHVDCSIGGKVAVNFDNAKNLLGGFYQPRLVLIDLDYLQTLPEREMRSGFAEVVKYGLAFDADFFDELERRAPEVFALDPDALTYVVRRSCEFKAKVVAEDELDRTGVRAVLNLGHTVGHAIEGATGETRYTHGEAIAIGMICACEIAERTGVCSEALSSRVESFLELAGFPTRIAGCEPEAVMKMMQHDEKASEGRLAFVLPTRIGHAELRRAVPPDIVRSVIEERIE